ncbi:MAG: hypothetical protein KAS72_02235 [Phycisphaerales bacterium]|nr:hypothetical protein [Phycisphaerales bacterium]
MMSLGAAVLLLGGSAAADNTRPNPEVSVNIDDLPTLHITTLGKIIKDDLQGLRDGCDHVETYSAGPFDGGGNIVLQAGFAEEEAAGCSYQIQPDNFPIKINLMEMVFGTSGASMETTTMWAIYIYDGLPTTGTLVASFASDGVILPHIVLPPGTNGVNLAVSVDPGDPEQIIINNDSGTNIFTIAYQIVEHNYQVGDPCLNPPPTCCNAFPATDVGGLNSTVNNWLYAIDCGAGGAPAGWNRFSSLGVFRPSGDWIMRVTWQEVDCQPGVGACCFPNGDCEVALVDDCQNAGGIYMGDGTEECPDTPCDPGDCPADLNGDGYIGQNDLGILLAYYDTGTDGGDVDGDGDTDQVDLGVLLAYYDTECP